MEDLPPGFRFSPFDDELLDYYLRRKLEGRLTPAENKLIEELDVLKSEPWDMMAERSAGRGTQTNECFAFWARGRKYSQGPRANRCTARGYWKSTGSDRVVWGGGRKLGMKKTLVFYTGKAPRGVKTDWVMHEYRMDNEPSSTSAAFVVCRIFKKVNNEAGTKPSAAAAAVGSAEAGAEDVAADEAGAEDAHSALDGKGLSLVCLAEKAAALNSPHGDATSAMPIPSAPVPTLLEDAHASAGPLADRQSPPAAAPVAQQHYGQSFRDDASSQGVTRQSEGRCKGATPLALFPEDGSSSWQAAAAEERRTGPLPSPHGMQLSLFTTAAPEPKAAPARALARAHPGAPVHSRATARMGRNELPLNVQAGSPGSHAGIQRPSLADVPCSRPASEDAGTSCAPKSCTGTQDPEAFFPKMSLASFMPSY